MSIESISGPPLRASWRNAQGLAPVRKPAGSRAIGPKSGKDPNHAFDEEEREAAGHDRRRDSERRARAHDPADPGSTIDESV